MASVGRWVVIDLSSSDDEDEETASEGEDKKTAFSSITKPKHLSVVEVLTKEEKEREDDDCYILAFNPFDSLTFDFNRSLNVENLENHENSEPGAEEEVVILSERGKVACKDYPHSRHHCAEYPFDKTPHESCCAKDSSRPKQSLRYNC